jgi:hypothetical protein
LTQCKAEQAIIGLAGRYQSRRARDRTPKQFHYAFTNTLSEEESAAVYERYHILAPGRFVWGGGLANFTPGYQDTYVNFKNDDRAPLLFIAGGDDNTCRRRSTSPTRTTTGGRRRSPTTRVPWPLPLHPRATRLEEVADYALDWATKHAASD